MRVVWISLGCLLLVGMTLLGAHNWGLSMNYQRFDHPFWGDDSRKPWIALRFASLDEARRAIALREDLILWIDARVTADQRVLTLTPGAIRHLLVEKSFPADKWRGPFPNRYRLDELRVLFPEAPLLEDVLREFPRQRVIINLVDNVTDAPSALVKALETGSPDQRILVQSETDVLIKSVKEQKPQWLYGSSIADLMRLMSLESVGILSACPFRGDVLIAPMKVSGRDAFTAGVIDEIHRRKKEVFLGPLEDGSEYDAARQHSPDAFILSSLELFHALLDQKRL